MSKTETESSKSPDDSLDKTLRVENKSLRLDLKTALERERANKLNFDKAQKKIAKLEAELSTRTPPKSELPPSDSGPSSSQPSTATTPTTSPTEKQARKEHTLDWVPKFCDKCVEPDGSASPNAEFQDETECTNCGLALGSEKYAATMVHCPNCGKGKEHGVGYRSKRR